MTIVRVNPGNWTDDTTTISAAQINGIDTNTTRAIDGTDGGTYNPTATILVGGQGLTCAGTSLIKLASRDVPKTMPLYCAQVLSNWAYDLAGMFWENTVAQGAMEFELIGLPHNQAIQKVALWCRGGQAHGAFPGGAPTPQYVELSTINDTGARVVLETITDSVADKATYEGNHWLFKDALAIPINTGGFRHVLTLYSESGANWATDSRVWSIIITCTCTSYPDW
jgi:hypothetical protein